MSELPEPSHPAAPAPPAVHLLRLAAANAHTALEAVRAGLDLSGGELAGLTLKPVGDIIEAALRVRQLTDEAAERLSLRLSSRPGVAFAHVEHVLGKAS